MFKLTLILVVITVAVALGVHFYLQANKESQEYEVTEISHDIKFKAVGNEVHIYASPEECKVLQCDKDDVYEGYYRYSQVPVTEIKEETEINIPPPQIEQPLNAGSVSFRIGQLF